MPFDSSLAVDKRMQKANLRNAVDFVVNIHAVCMGIVGAVSHGTACRSNDSVSTKANIKHYLS